MKIILLTMLETHPVCSPKYIFEKQMINPTPNPTSTPLVVKFCPSLAWLAINLLDSLRPRWGALVSSSYSSLSSWPCEAREGVIEILRYFGLDALPLSGAMTV